VLVRIGGPPEAAGTGGQILSLAALAYIHACMHGQLGACMCIHMELDHAQLSSGIIKLHVRANYMYHDAHDSNHPRY
jgi:hypothetical protein